MLWQLLHCHLLYMKQVLDRDWFSALCIIPNQHYPCFSQNGTKIEELRAALDQHLITWLSAIRRNSELPLEPHQTAPGEMGAPEQQQGLCSTGRLVTSLGVISRKQLESPCRQEAVLYTSLPFCTSTGI